MIRVKSLRGNRTMEVGAVRIDRKSEWGNPYPMQGTSDAERTRVIKLYRQWIGQRPQLIEELRRRKPTALYCWCYPKACHGDVLIELLEEGA
jgi:hypothetical protein